MPINISANTITSREITTSASPEKTATHTVNRDIEIMREKMREVGIPAKLSHSVAESVVTLINKTDGKFAELGPVNMSLAVLLDRRDTLEAELNQLLNQELELHKQISALHLLMSELDKPDKSVADFQRVVAEIRKIVPEHKLNGEWAVNVNADHMTADNMSTFKQTVEGLLQAQLDESRQLQAAWNAKLDELTKAIDVAKKMAEMG
jgi:hypothetical protein